MTGFPHTSKIGREQFPWAELSLGQCSEFVVSAKVSAYDFDEGICTSAAKEDVFSLVRSIIEKERRSCAAPRRFRRARR